MGLTCKKEEEHKLVDLSYSNLGGVYPNDWGAWVVYYQSVDSIDVNNKPYLSSDWPSFNSGFDFALRLLNNERTLYLKNTQYSDINFKQRSVFDTAIVDKFSGAFIANIYNNLTYDSVPEMQGKFIGKYNQTTNQMEGFFEYQAKWFCSYCPVGTQYRTAKVTVPAIGHNY